MVEVVVEVEAPSAAMVSDLMPLVRYSRNSAQRMHFTFEHTQKNCVAHMNLL